MSPNRKPAPTKWEEYVAGVVAWLSTEWGTKRPCPYCGSTEWRIGPVREIPSAPNWPTETADESDGSGFIPAVPITSLKCGHIVFVNALWIFEPQEVRLLIEQSGEVDLPF